MRVRAERLVLVLHSWIDSFADGRVYRVGPAGLERDFEKWLVEQLDRLADVGYPLRLEQRGRQRRLAGCD